MAPASDTAVRIMTGGVPRTLRQLQVVKGARTPRGCCTVLADTTSTDPSVLADGPTTNLLYR